MRRNTWIFIGLAMLAALLFAGSAGVAVAQQTASSEEQEVTAEQLEQHVGRLTDEQREQVKSINLSRREQIKAVAQDSSLTGEQKAARVRQISRGANDQINGLLDPGQRERFYRIRRDRREDVRDRREDVRDRREDRRDGREDVRDRREDVRDRKHDGGVRDRREDRRDQREDVRDRKEDRRDRREDKRDRKEDRRDRRRRP